VSLIERGRPAFATGRTISDYIVRSPMVDVHVIGAGGGSIAWLDDAGALKVGPRSAGADPGPAAYGRGGADPTLTDANIVLHRLDPTSLLGGRMPVDADAARGAVARRIAQPTGLSMEEAALGIIRIAVANMSRAIRSVSTTRGHDAREFVLFAYGGAGPLHAAAVASECGIRRVLVPVEPGTMCARGILLSDLSLDLVRSEISTADQTGWPDIMQRFAIMEATGTAWLESENIPPDRRRFACVIEARYKGQNHEVQVRLAGRAFADFVAAFAEAHRREYGYDVPDRVIEVVNCRLKAIGLINRPAPEFVGGVGAPQPKAERQVYFDAGWITTPVFARSGLAVDTWLAGPAVIDEMSATTLVPPGWALSVDRIGNLLLELAP
jgi:N-methylhydantoinase A